VLAALGRGCSLWCQQATRRSTGSRSAAARCDLRHAALLLWLNSGVPTTEVARRAGHRVAVLLKIYAHCIDGQSDAANRRITDALGATEPEPGLCDEGDADSESAA
jgi:hypothetical protein